MIPAQELGPPTLDLPEGGWGEAEESRILPPVPNDLSIEEGSGNPRLRPSATPKAQVSVNVGGVVGVDRATALSAGWPSRPSVASALEQLRKAREGTRPVAMVGFKEWIFSHKSGALGSFAAAAEVSFCENLIVCAPPFFQHPVCTQYVFGALLQRDMAWGRVRLHYGHPDVFDKLHCMTRVRVIHEKKEQWPVCFIQPQRPPPWCRAA